MIDFTIPMNIKNPDLFASVRVVLFSLFLSEHEICYEVFSSLPMRGNTWKKEAIFGTIGDLRNFYIFSVSWFHSSG
jgi:hypothetical protein